METKQPSNSGKTLVKRDKRGRVLPGSRLNPEGPTPGYKIKNIGYWTNKILEQLPENSEKTFAELIANRGIQMALQGQFNFYKELRERTEGKVTDELRADITGMIAHTEVGEDKLEGVVDEFIKSFRKKLNEPNKNKVINPRTD
jgi:hypothetical protein